MIKYYTYYSFGGYKDLYLGDWEQSESQGYYLPLADNSEVLPPNLYALSEMTDEFYASMPKMMGRAFSYGGYDEMLTAEGRDGTVSLIIRDIPSLERDESGKSIKFVIAFVADAADADVLYGLFKMAVRHREAIFKEFSSMLHYDPSYNGLCFEAQAMRNFLASIPRGNTFTQAHTEGLLDNLIVTRLCPTSIVVKDLGLSKSRSIVFLASRFASKSKQ